MQCRRSLRFYFSQPFVLRTILSLAFLLPLCGLTAFSAQAKPPSARLWVGQFDQCSYNALASALVYLRGPVPHYSNRAGFEQKTFVAPLNIAGYGPYFGWAPWTSYMINSKKLVWDGHAVRHLGARRFSLATREIPKVVNRGLILVRYAPGERKKLIARLDRALRRGPVIIWTPYAAELDPRSHPWNMVKRVKHNLDAVPFNPSLTHAITVFRLGHGKVLVTDCSVWNGVYTTTPRIVVSVAAAMSASVRVRFGDQPSIFQRGLHGVRHDQFDVSISVASKAAK